LARIRMGLELMNVPAAEPDALARSRAEILRNMAELDQLIDEILLASRLDAKEADIGTVEAVDLVGLCAEECARVGASFDVPEGLAQLEVSGVAKLLRRMVRNLLENARRYGAVSPETSQDAGIVLSLKRQAQQVLIEVGDRGPGVPLEYRERIFEPFFRLPGASERVGGVDGVARAKAELVESLPASGFAVLNADDARVVAMRSKTSAEAFTYGIAANADVRISDLVLNSHGCASFRITSQWGNGSCTLTVPGKHMASNAAAAVLVGALCGVSVADALRAVEHTKMSPMRMQVHALTNGILLDDSYNASPTSMAAALHTLASMRADHRVAVLGVMAEISDTEMQHRNIAQLAQDLGIEVIAFQTDLYGLASSNTYEEVHALLQKRSANTAILLKGSRVAGLDAVTQLLLGN
jgi:hypothetical protein